MNEILERIKEHNEETSIPKEGIFFTALNGSQNYGLDDKYSDIDTNLLYIPSIHDIAKNKYVKREFRLPNDEHCNIKDVREFFNMFRKGNINFVELLFTKWAVVNPLYADYYNELISNREVIARYNEKQTLNCALGMAVSKYHHIIDEPKENYRPKDLMNIIRLEYFVSMYILGQPYKECIAIGESEKLRDFMLEIKREHGAKEYTQDSLFALETIDKMKKKVDNYNYKIDEKRQEIVENLFTTLAQDLIIARMRNDGVI